MCKSELNLFPSYKSKYFEPFICKGYKGKYDIYFYDFDKKKRNKKVTKTNIQKEAIKALNLFKKSYLSNKTQVNIKVLLELIDVIYEVNQNNLSKRTLEIYSNAIKKLINVVGNKEIRLITYWDIEEFKKAYSSRLSKQSMNIYLRTLKAAFNYSKKIGLIEENPLNGIKQYKIPDSNKLSFEKNEIEFLLNTIDIPYLKQIVSFALYTGCRISEILNLRLEDIDLERMVIKICNKPDFLTKTRKEREIPIYGGLQNLIFEIFEQQQAQYKIFNSNIYELTTKKQISV